MEQLGNASKADAKDLKEGLQAARKKILNQSTSGLSPKVQETRKQLIKDSEKAIKDTGSAGSWCTKLGHFLDMINVVAVGAKAVGYAAEGDYHGAAGAVVDELTKKVATGIGAFLGAPVPYLGPVVGASAGEEFHDAYTRKALEKNINDIRTQEAKDRMLNSGIPEVQVMGESGTRTLPSDIFVDPVTGNIQRRTPEQQHAYREEIGRELKERAASTHPLDIAMEKLKRGEITQTEFDRTVEEYNATNKNSKETGEDSEEGEEGTEETPNPAGATDIPPVRVTAKVVFDGDYSFQEFKNIVTTVVNLSFWNVGDLVPGYGGVTVNVTNTASLNGVTEKVSGTGTFSGGPNGLFNLTVGGKNVRGALVNGAGISYGGKQGTVDNPKAFMPWEK